MMEAIPSGLQALISATQALNTLQQTAAPTTPQGAPTVAGAAQQALAQRLQGGSGAGIAQVAQQAQNAAPILQQQAQEAQAQQIAQQAAQMMQGQQQGPGIAGLPAGNMQFKEGGVIGYAVGGNESLDEDEDEVDDTEDTGDEELDVPGGIAAAISPARIKQLQAAREKLLAQKLPNVLSAASAYKQLEGMTKPWEAQRKGIAGLSQQQADILKRQLGAIEAEKEGDPFARQLAFWGAQGVGGGAHGLARFDAMVRAREAQATKRLQEDLEFKKELLGMENAVNKDEFNYHKEQALRKVTDSQKAAELFQKDRATLVKAINGEYGPAMRLLGTAYTAEQRRKAAEAKARSGTAAKFNLDEAQFNAEVAEVAKEKKLPATDSSVRAEAARRVRTGKAVAGITGAESRATAQDIAQARDAALSLPPGTSEAERKEWVYAYAEALANRRARRVGTATGASAPSGRSTPPPPPGYEPD